MADPIVVEELFLTSEDQRTLEELTPALDMLARNIAKMERAGMDVTTQKADLEKAKALRDGVLRELTKK